MKVTILPSGEEFQADATSAVLESALAAGLNLPHSCRSGNCGSCRARILSGTFHYPNGRPLGISDAAEARIKRLPCRIERCERWSHDVMGIFLRMPAAEGFEFLPGQYLDILLPSGHRRSFSIASPPPSARLIELHVRLAAGGEFTPPLFAQTAEKKLLTIEGPLGQFVYRQSAAPMLLIGGGTGLAPLKSIIEHIVNAKLDRRMMLFWGCCAERDLYADEWIKSTLRRTPHLEYVPVLSDASPQWRGARGLVHAEVLRQVADLAGHDIYASGPPAMINAVRTEFAARGAGADRLYFDSFDYAADSAARHRRMASTSS